MSIQNVNNVSHRQQWALSTYNLYIVCVYVCVCCVLFVHTKFIILEKHIYFKLSPTKENSRERQKKRILQNRKFKYTHMHPSTWQIQSIKDFVHHRKVVNIQNIQRYFMCTTWNSFVLFYVDDDGGGVVAAAAADILFRSFFFIIQFLFYFVCLIFAAGNQACVLLLLWPIRMWEEIWKMLYFSVCV